MSVDLVCVDVIVKFRFDGVRCVDVVVIAVGKG